MNGEVEYDTEVEFDVEKVLALLEVVNESKDEPNLKPLFDAAYRALVAMAAELQEKKLKAQKEKESE